MAVSSFVVQRKEIFDVLCCTNDAKFSGRKKGPHGLPFYFKTRWLLQLLCGVDGLIIQGIKIQILYIKLGIWEKNHNLLHQIQFLRCHPEQRSQDKVDL